MEVEQNDATGLPVRLDIIDRIKKEKNEIKTALLCDEVAYPELAKDVMRAKQDRRIDVFFYSSLSIDYLVDSLDAL